jgi:nitroimidazol reductase NimA-like FMN-containing flavoprotein (pyridoxamine 5'-phosphate oxidase superfamily)
MIRNLTEKERMHLLTNNYIGHLGYIYRNRPFIAPITYFFDESINAVIGYSSEGHKISAMRKNNAVSLAISSVDSVNVWDSILIHGNFEELEGSEAKAHLHTFSLGVKDLIIRKEHRKLDFISQFSSKIYKDNIPVVFLIKVQGITGKKRRYE